MPSFDIPDLLAPLWSDPTAAPKPINEQVGDLVDAFATSGNNGAVRALMQGLAVIDRHAVHDRMTDAREWEIAGEAIRRAFAENQGKPPSGERLLDVLVSQLGKAEAIAEESESFRQVSNLRRVASTHQRDQSFGTLWDAERCVAASVVAALALKGEGNLASLAREVKGSLLAERALFAQAKDKSAAGGPEADAAREAALSHLTVLVGALNLRAQTTLERLGWNHAKPGSNPPGILLDPQHPERGFWVREESGKVVHLRPASTEQPTSALLREPAAAVPEGLLCLVPPEGVTPSVGATDKVMFPTASLSVELLTATRSSSSPERPERMLELKQIPLDPRPAALMVALAQVAGAEGQIYDDAMGVLDGELARVDGVLAQVETGAALSSEALQVLADTLCYASRTTPVAGSNYHPVGQLLRRAGIDAAPPADGVARTFPELAASSRPGEAYLLGSQDHAVGYFHLPDGRRLIYDSEGVFHVNERECLATYDPEKAPRRSEALARHYRGFYGMLRLSLS